MKKIFTDKEENDFLTLIDRELLNETWESFDLDVSEDDVSFPEFYVKYQELHLLKYGKYLDINLTI